MRYNSTQPRPFLNTLNSMDSVSPFEPDRLDFKVDPDRVGSQVCR